MNKQEEERDRRTETEDRWKEEKAVWKARERESKIMNKWEEERRGKKYKEGEM